MWEFGVNFKFAAMSAQHPINKKASTSKTVSSDAGSRTQILAIQPVLLTFDSEEWQTPTEDNAVRQELETTAVSVFSESKPSNELLSAQTKRWDSAMLRRWRVVSCMGSQHPRAPVRFKTMQYLALTSFGFPVLDSTRSRLRATYPCPFVPRLRSREAPGAATRWKKGLGFVQSAAVSLKCYVIHARQLVILRGLSRLLSLWAGSRRFPSSGVVTFVYSAPFYYCFYHPSLSLTDTPTHTSNVLAVSTRNALLRTHPGVLARFLPWHPASRALDDTSVDCCALVRAGADGMPMLINTHPGIEVGAALELAVHFVLFASSFASASVHGYTQATIAEERRCGNILVIVPRTLGDVGGAGQKLGSRINNGEGRLTDAYELALVLTPTAQARWGGSCSSSPSSSDPSFWSCSPSCIQFPLLSHLVTTHRCPQYPSTSRTRSTFSAGLATYNGAELPTNPHRTHPVVWYRVPLGGSNTTAVMRMKIQKFASGTPTRVPPAPNFSLLGVQSSSPPS
ncbi:hypothetical protein C8R45DRAFT_1078643 [Mycena sanguinolenta]|nr:hypothetical protein C8R45DRAFT_1078643 [Mycena sanguinolenta]